MEKEHVEKRMRNARGKKVGGCWGTPEPTRDSNLSILFFVIFLVVVWSESRGGLFGEREQILSRKNIYKNIIRSQLILYFIKNYSRYTLSFWTQIYQLFIIYYYFLSAKAMENPKKATGRKNYYNLVI